MAMLNDSYNGTIQTPLHKYRRFCEAPKVTETPEGPALVMCGLGYQKKGRKNKDLNYCRSCLKSEIQRQRFHR